MCRESSQLLFTGLNILDVASKSTRHSNRRDPRASDDRTLRRGTTPDRRQISNGAEFDGLCFFPALPYLTLPYLSRGQRSQKRPSRDSIFYSVQASHHTSCEPLAWARPR